MAMTTTPLYFASPIPQQSNSTNPHTFYFLPSRISIAKRSSLFVRLPPQLVAAVVVVETASAVVEVEPKKTAATPPNSLPLSPRDPRCSVAQGNRFLLILQLLRHNLNIIC
ncbi:unnamed protein product [Camellia sinensis]